MTDVSSGLSSKALRVEQARIGRFLESMAKHRRALELAIEEGFGGALDPAEWRRAFESDEPRDANRTMVVTGDHSALLNAYVEILKASAGSRMVGLLPFRRPHAGQTFEALVEDGCLTGDQAAELNAAYAIEGRLEHASPDVDASEVLEAIERFRKALPALMEAVLAWLGRHGVHLDEQR
jgi:hypothetical protein